MPEYWWQVYPHGTEEGDEENRFFRALCREPEYKWRSVDKLAEYTKMPPERVEEIIAKYASRGMIYQNPKNPNMWGYWERVGERFEESDIIEEENNNRLGRK